MSLSIDHQARDLNHITLAPTHVLIVCSELSTHREPCQPAPISRLPLYTYMDEEDAADVHAASRWRPLGPGEALAPESSVPAKPAVPALAPPPPPTSKISVEKLAR